MFVGRLLYAVPCVRLHIDAWLGCAVYVACDCGHGASRIGAKQQAGPWPGALRAQEQQLQCNSPRLLVHSRSGVSIEGEVAAL